MAEFDHLLDLTVPVDREEEIRTALWLAGSSGDYEHDGVLTAFFETSRARDRAAEELRELAVDVAPRDAARENWLDRYQQSLRALPVGRRFIVTPDPDLVEDPGDRIVLHIPQERAFGTGSHESTALCLEMLERLNLHEAAGVDVGTGSGILALAMLKLGARRAIAFDNDPEISGVIHRNMARNGIDRQRLLAFVGTTDAFRPLSCEVVTMNILPEVIIPLLAEVSAWLHSGSSVIVSGIVAARRDEVVAAAAAEALVLEAEASSGEWWCGLLGRN